MSKKLTELTNEELRKNEKTVKMLTYMLGISMLLLFAATIILAIKKGFSPLNVVAIALLPILIININSLKEIQKEKKARGL